MLTLPFKCRIEFLKIRRPLSDKDSQLKINILRRLTDVTLPSIRYFLCMLQISTLKWKSRKTGSTNSFIQTIVPTINSLKGILWGKRYGEGGKPILNIGMCRRLPSIRVLYACTMVGFRIAELLLLCYALVLFASNRAAVNTKRAKFQFSRDNSFQSS